MDAHELQEQTEHAHEKGQKGVGLTMAVTAVLLAVATLLSGGSASDEMMLSRAANSHATARRTSGR